MCKGPEEKHIYSYIGKQFFSPDSISLFIYKKEFPAFFYAFLN